MRLFNVLLWNIHTRGGGGGGGGAMVSWLACLIFTAAIGVRIPVVAVKFHIGYDNIIERQPWQVSENHKPRVHPSHVREIG